MASVGLGALIVSGIGLWDALAWMIIEKNLYQPSHDQKTPESLPLIVYGIATAVAWTCISRAVFPMVSIEATHLLSKMGGLQQRKLSEMLELKWPTKQWLYWRCRMWRSSIFAASCLIIYSLAAVIYRLAFISQDITSHSIYDHVADAILDCPYPQMERPLNPGLIGMYTYLTSPAASDFPIFVNSAPEFASGGSLASGNHG
jgi:hypothetical protein